MQDPNFESNFFIKKELLEDDIFILRTLHIFRILPRYRVTNKE